MNAESPRIPAATYRLQFNAHFRFSDARDVIHYLSTLGISDIYASPYFKASTGSLHGYDILVLLEKKLPLFLQQHIHQDELHLQVSFQLVHKL